MTSAEQKARLEEALAKIENAKEILRHCMDYGTTGYGPHAKAGGEAENHLNIAMLDIGVCIDHC